MGERRVNEDQLRAEALAYVRATTWTYARTMADRPHWYVIVPKEQNHRIEALLTLMHRHGTIRRWHRTPYVTVDLGGWQFWKIDQVVNKKPSHAGVWDGDPEPPASWLPDEYRRDLRGDERWWLDESDHWGDDVDAGEHS
jgi:hypothetical protein